MNAATDQTTEPETVTPAETVDNNLTQNPPVDETSTPPDAPAAAQEDVPQPPTERPAVEQDATPGRITRIRTAVRNWWGFVAEPMTVAETWRESGVIVAHRIPADSKLLALLWWVDNHSGRLALFLLLGVAPTWANGPLLWCAAKPGRRAGLYIVLTLLFFCVPRWVS